MKLINQLITGYCEPSTALSSAVIDSQNVFLNEE